MRGEDRKRKEEEGKEENRGERTEKKRRGGRGQEEKRGERKGR